MMEVERNHEASPPREEIGIADLIAVLLRWRWLIIISVAVAAIIAAGYYAFGLARSRAGEEPEAYEASLFLVSANDTRARVAELLVSPEIAGSIFIGGSGERPSAEVIAAQPVEKVDRDSIQRRIGGERFIRVRTSRWKDEVGSRDLSVVIGAESEASAALAAELAVSLLNKELREYNAAIKESLTEQIGVDPGDPVSIEAFARSLALKQIVVWESRPSETRKIATGHSLPSVRSLITFVAAVFCLSVFAAFALTWFQGFLKNEDNRRKLRDALGRKDRKGAS